jgi:RNA polymerase sigma factor (sigma-70 family)
MMPDREINFRPDPGRDHGRHAVGAAAIGAAPAAHACDELTAERFDRFLAWISADPEVAGRRYLEICARLRKMFSSRGCDHAEDLADTTLDRVIRKIDRVTQDYLGDPMAYVHGVAKKVYLEYQRAQARDRTQALRLAATRAHAGDAEDERRHVLLARCLDTLDASDRELILRYYRDRGAPRIQLRHLLAQDAGVSQATLRKRTQRIRKRLRALLVSAIERGRR